MFLSRDRTSVKLMTHTPEIGADFSYQMRSGTKKSAPKIDMDDAKIDNNGIHQSPLAVVWSRVYQKLARNRTRN